MSSETKGAAAGRRLSGRIVAATHNRGKLLEIQELLSPYGIEAIGAGELGLSEPEETGLTFAENAILKAIASARASGEAALADDSGLCVAALGDAPGIYSARWAGGSKDFAGAMARVENELLSGAAPRPWRAHFVSALALAWPDGWVETFEGRVRRRARLPAARRQRLRLRSHLQARRPFANVWRNDLRGKAWTAGGWFARPVPPRPRVPKACPCRSLDPSAAWRGPAPLRKLCGPRIVSARFFDPVTGKNREDGARPRRPATKLPLFPNNF